MAIDEKITKIENLTKQIEGEKSFDKTIVLFTQAAELIKQALKEGTEQKGRVLEIVRELDAVIERELKSGEDE